jgi:uncharacterized protein YkuJ
MIKTTASFVVNVEYHAFDLGEQVEINTANIETDKYKFREGTTFTVIEFFKPTSVFDNDAVVIVRNNDNNEAYTFDSLHLIACKKV